MINNKELFFDHNASHPLLKSVREGLCEKLQGATDFFSNPMSVHGRGRIAKRVLFELRESLCQWLGLRNDSEVVFNSGATEGINSVLRGFVRNRKDLGRKPVLFYSAIEHSAVHNTVADLIDVECVEIPVCLNGQLDQDFIAQQIERVLSDDKADVLFALQVANNETGMCFDFSFQSKLLAEYGSKPLTKLPKKKGGKFPHTPQRIWYLLDAAQALGKIDESDIRKPLHFADYMVLSAHKIGGPMGIGALWIRGSSPYHPILFGGSQEKKRRAGTHNMIGVYGFLLAVRDWMDNGAIYREKMAKLTEYLEREIAKIPGVKFNSTSASNLRLCNTLNLSAKQCPDESLLMGLDLRKVFVSSGAACNSGSVKPSAVLSKMGFPEDIARSSIRISLGTETVQEDVDGLLKELKSVIEQVRGAQKMADELLPNLGRIGEGSPLE
ncbi:aminotransferase class V-fold PLP-dependent enzyme [bacterium]|nr:aminotransferase class V-fold PLP-dependent enzyme [bacterium]